MLSVASICFAANHPNERTVVNLLAEKYQANVEVKLWDDTRVDLLSETHAYEVDWARKYAEGVGQALYYSSLTARKPGLILLVRNFKKELRYIYRAQITCNEAGVDLYIETVKDFPIKDRQPNTEDKDTSPVISKQLADVDPPIRVYFVYDSETDKWYQETALGTSAWDFSANK